MSYRLVAVRDVNDPFDPLYPRLTDGAKGIVTYPASDGTNVMKFAANQLAIGNFVQGGPVQWLGKFTEGTSIAFLTDSRLLVHNHGFKTADVGLAAWGWNKTYLASAALSKMRTRNRALTGHYPLLCLRRVELFRTQKKNNFSYLRIFIEDGTGEANWPKIVELATPRTEALGLFNRALLERYARYWLNNAERLGIKLPEEKKLQLGLMTRRKAVESEVFGKWVSFDTPAYVGLAPHLFKHVGHVE